MTYYNATYSNLDSVRIANNTVCYQLIFRLSDNALLLFCPDPVNYVY